MIMKIKNIVTFMTLAIFIFIASINIQAQQRPGPDNRKGMNIPNLTETQKTQIKGFRKQLNEEALPLRNLLREKEAQLETLSTTKGADINKINTKIDEIGDLKNQLAKKRAAFRQNVRKILDDEQRVAYDTHFQKNKTRKMSPPKK